MKIVKFSTLPVSFTGPILARHATADMDWQALTALLFGEFFGPVDSWQYWLRQSGIDATDILHGTPEVDAAWARAKGLADVSGDDIVIAEAIERQPDVIVLQGFESRAPAFIARLRDAVPRAKLAGIAGVDIRGRSHAGTADLLFSCMRENVDFVLANGGRAQHLMHAFDERILDRVEPAERQPVAAFVGSLESGAHLHDARRTMLETVTRSVPVWMYSTPEPPALPMAIRTAKMAAARIAANAWSAVPGRLGLAPPPALALAANWPSFPRLWRPQLQVAKRLDPVFGLAMYRVLGESLIVLNAHVGMTRYAANLRLTEACGMGACLVTDAKEGLHDMFTPDEVVAYRSPAEAASLTKALLASPADAAAIGARAQARIMRDHSYRVRSQQIAATLRALLA
jgi:hypothetical protein